MSGVNRLVAQIVCGFKRRREMGSTWEVSPESPFFREWDGAFVDTAPNFDEDIGCAFKAVEMFMEHQPNLAVSTYSVKPDHHACQIYRCLAGRIIFDDSQRVASVVDDTLPAAICTALLLACAVSKEVIIASREAARAAQPNTPPQAEFARKL